ncbi:hypothetical protein JKP88DRAFT_255179 [Tribonema minus]|uniref:Uncharacterized protein n=1 Tax=Tribonema minus TaxID=303371 RepID=A0A836CGW9_9STRA|nr:hypothetical protein JKP88DRAFT_255179 [Tribonema minus]
MSRRYSKKSWAPARGTSFPEDDDSDEGIPLSSAHPERPFRLPRRAQVTGNEGVPVGTPADELQRDAIIAAYEKTIENLIAHLRTTRPATDRSRTRHSVDPDIASLRSRIEVLIAERDGARRDRVDPEVVSSLQAQLTAVTAGHAEELQRIREVQNQHLDAEARLRAQIDVLTRERDDARRERVQPGAVEALTAQMAGVTADHARELQRVKDEHIANLRDVETRFAAHETVVRLEAQLEACKANLAAVGSVPDTSSGNVLRDILTGIRDDVKGRMIALETELAEAKENAASLMTRLESCLEARMEALNTSIDGNATVDQLRTTARLLAEDRATAAQKLVRALGKPHFDGNLQQLVDDVIAALQPVPTPTHAADAAIQKLREALQRADGDLLELVNAAIERMKIATPPTTIHVPVAENFMAVKAFVPTDDTASSTVQHVRSVARLMIAYRCKGRSGTRKFNLCEMLRVAKEALEVLATKQSPTDAQVQELTRARTLVDHIQDVNAALDTVNRLEEELMMHHVNGGSHTDAGFTGALDDYMRATQNVPGDVLRDGFLLDDFLRAESLSDVLQLFAGVSDLVVPIQVLCEGRQRCCNEVLRIKNGLKQLVVLPTTPADVSIALMFLLGMITEVEAERQRVAFEAAAAKKVADDAAAASRKAATDKEREDAITQLRQLLGMDGGLLELVNAAIARMKTAPGPTACPPPTTIRVAVPEDFMAVKAFVPNDDTASPTVQHVRSVARLMIAYRSKGRSGMRKFYLCEMLRDAKEALEVLATKQSPTDAQVQELTRAKTLVDHIQDVNAALDTVNRLEEELMMHHVNGGSHTDAGFTGALDDYMRATQNVPGGVLRDGFLLDDFLRAESLSNVLQLFAGVSDLVVPIQVLCEGRQRCCDEVLRIKNGLKQLVVLPTTPADVSTALMSLLGIITEVEAERQRVAFEAAAAKKVADDAAAASRKAATDRELAAVTAKLRQTLGRTDGDLANLVDAIIGLRAVVGPAVVCPTPVADAALLERYNELKAYVHKAQDPQSELQVLKSVARFMVDHYSECWSAQRKYILCEKVHAANRQVHALKSKQDQLSDAEANALQQAQGLLDHVPDLSARLSIFNDLENQLLLLRLQEAPDGAAYVDLFDRYTAAAVGIPDDIASTGLTRAQLDDLSTLNDMLDIFAVDPPDLVAAIQALCEGRRHCCDEVMRIKHDLRDVVGKMVDLSRPEVDIAILRTIGDLSTAAAEAQINALRTVAAQQAAAAAAAALRAAQQETAQQAAADAARKAAADAAAAARHAAEQQAATDAAAAQKAAADAAAATQQAADAAERAAAAAAAQRSAVQAAAAAHEQALQKAAADAAAQKAATDAATAAQHAAAQRDAADAQARKAADDRKRQTVTARDAKRRAVVAAEHRDDEVTRAAAAGGDGRAARKRARAAKNRLRNFHNGLPDEARFNVFRNPPETAADLQGQIDQLEEILPGADATLAVQDANALLEVAQQVEQNARELAPAGDAQPDLAQWQLRQAINARQSAEAAVRATRLTIADLARRLQPIDDIIMAADANTALFVTRAVEASARDLNEGGLGPPGEAQQIEEWGTHARQQAEQAVRDAQGLDADAEIGVLQALNDDDDTQRKNAAAAAVAHLPVYQSIGRRRKRESGRSPPAEALQAGDDDANADVAGAGGADMDAEVIRADDDDANADAAGAGGADMDAEVIQADDQGDADVPGVDMAVDGIAQAGQAPDAEVPDGAPPAVPAPAEAAAVPAPVRRRRTQLEMLAAQGNGVNRDARAAAAVLAAPVRRRATQLEMLTAQGNGVNRDVRGAAAAGGDGQKRRRTQTQFYGNSKEYCDDDDDDNDADSAGIYFLTSTEFSEQGVDEHDLH